MEPEARAARPGSRTPVTFGIDVDGMDDYRDGLRQLGGQLDEALEDAGEDIADLVVLGARRGFKAVTGRGRGSIVARPDGGRPAVGYDTGRAPYGPWYDFGGRVGRGGNVFRPYKPRGRFVIPSMEQIERSGEGEEIVEEHVARAADRAGLRVT